MGGGSWRISVLALFPAFQAIPGGRRIFTNNLSLRNGWVFIVIIFILPLGPAPANGLEVLGHSVMTVYLRELYRLVILLFVDTRDPYSPFKEQVYHFKAPILCGTLENCSTIVLILTSFSVDINTSTQ